MRGRSIDAIYQLLRGDDMAHLGLRQQYPLLVHLYATALTIPMSTAEEERVFSQLALIKTDHRNQLKEETRQELLNVKLSLPQGNHDSILSRVAVHWLSGKERRISVNGLDHCGSICFIE